jgi:hypothetical protein
MVATGTADRDEGTVPGRGSRTPDAVVQSSAGRALAMAAPSPRGRLLAFAASIHAQLIFACPIWRETALIVVLPSLRGWHPFGENRIFEICSAQVNWDARVKWPAIPFGPPAPDDGYSCFHIRGEPGLAGVLPNERGQDFHYGRLISGKIQGHLLQDVDGSDPQLGFPGAELLDRLRLRREPGDSPREPVAPPSKHKRASGKQASAKRQQLRPRGLPRCLQVHRSLRARNPPNVVYGEKVGDWPDQREDDCRNPDRSGGQNDRLVLQPPLVRSSWLPRHGKTLRPKAGRWP